MEPAQTVTFVGWLVMEAGVHVELGMMALHKPLPYVDAAIVRSLDLYLSILVFTVGNVDSTVQTVLEPFIASVLQTPASVAMYILVSASGW